MKKILSKALIINTTLFLAACNTNTKNTNSSSDQDASKSKTEKKEIKKQSQNKQPSGSGSAKSSIAVDSKIKMSHSKWLSDKFLKNELKTFSQYNNLYKKWIKSSDGKDALQKAYELSDDGKDEFNTKFNDWKKQHGQERDIVEFKTEMSQKDSEAYQIYKEWATSDDGQEKIKTTFNDDQDVFDNKFQEFLKVVKYWKTSEDYIDLDVSLGTYENWRTSSEAVEVLKPLFKNSDQDYQNAYDSWKVNNYRTKEEYILDPKSQNNFDAWRLTQDGQAALKPLYRIAGRNDPTYIQKSQKWIQDNLLTIREYYRSSKSDIGFSNWLNSQDGQDALEAHYKGTQDYFRNIDQWKRSNPYTPEQVIDNSQSGDLVHQSFNRWRIAEGKDALADVFKNSGEDLNNKYDIWKLLAKNLKSAEDYAKDADSIDQFNRWKNTPEAKRILIELFENSGGSVYESAYDKWKETQPIKSPEQFWDGIDYNGKWFNDWLESQDGRSAILPLITKRGADQGEAIALWKADNPSKDNAYFLDTFIHSGLEDGKIGEYAEKFAKIVMKGSNDRQKDLIKQSFIRAIYLPPNGAGNNAAKTSYDNWLKTLVVKKTPWNYVNNDASDTGFNDWIQSIDGRERLLLIFKEESSAFDTAYNNWKLNAGNAAKSKEKFINSGLEDAENEDDKNIGEYVENWANLIWNGTTQDLTALRKIKYAFVEALYKTSGDGDKAIKDKYSEYKYKTKDDYKASLNIIENDALLWADSKRMDSNYNVINEFIKEIEKNLSGANNAYLAWRKLSDNHKSPNDYKRSDDIKDDAADWARNKMKLDSNVKSAFANAMLNFGPFYLTDAYANNWKLSRPENDYWNHDDFKNHLSAWAKTNKLSNNDIWNRFEHAIDISKNTDGDNDLQNSYEGAKYKSEDEYEASDKFAEDAGEYWAAGKLTTDDDVKGEFIRAITTSKKTSGDDVAKGKFDSWKIKDKSLYEVNPQYGLDASSWAIGKRQGVVKPEFKKALDGVAGYTSSDHQVAKDVFDIWKKPNADFYKNNRVEYIADIKWYIDNKNNENAIQNALEEVIKLPATNNDPKEGNDILKDKFMLWKPLSKDNFLKTKNNKDAILAWKINTPTDHVSIREVISNVLNDKELANKATGNSEFISSLKKISQRAYEEYLAKN